MTISTPVASVFQYPPCGSSRCNLALMVSRLLSSIFQYPPCGSCNHWPPPTAISRRSSFSTLHAGRVAATEHEHPAPGPGSRLSVPSMRVESLQPQQWSYTISFPDDFQYPPCGSSRCNDEQRGRSRRSRSLFQYPPCGSSRCNITGASTACPTSSFQYPPCGSSRCNLWCPWQVGRISRLSVPSMRVESLQHDRTTACGSRSAGLSVPSMRVESLQLPAMQPTSSVSKDFQYPPCGSSRCNRGDHLVGCCLA